jgi:hypothetical protein
MSPSRDPHSAGLDCPRVGVEQEFAGIESKSCTGTIRPAGAEAICLARADAGSEAVPYPSVILRQWKPRLVSIGIEETQIHALGSLRAHREVGSADDRCGPQREPIARQYLGHPGRADSHGPAIG